MEEDTSLYMVDIKAAGDVRITVGASWVHFEEVNDIRRSPFVFVMCNFKRVYLDIDIGSREMQAIFDVSMPMASAIEPLKEEYKIGDRLNCRGNTSTATLRTTFYLSSKPKNFGKRWSLNSAFTIDKSFVGGVYVVQCLIARPYSMIYAHPHRFFIRQLPTTAKIVPKWKKNKLLYLKCMSDGFPTVNHYFDWRVTEHPGGLVLVQKDYLFILEYTASGPIRITCYVSATEGKDTVTVTAWGMDVVTGNSFDHRVIRFSNRWIPFIFVTFLWSLACLILTVGVFRFSKFNLGTRGGSDSILDDALKMEVGRRYISIRESDIGPLYVILFHLILHYSELYHTVQRIGLKRLVSNDLSSCRSSHLVSSAPADSVGRTSASRCDIIDDGNAGAGLEERTDLTRISAATLDDFISVGDASVNLLPRRLSTTVRPATHIPIGQPTGKRDSILITDNTYYRDRRLSLDIRRFEEDGAGSENADREAEDQSKGKEPVDEQNEENRTEHRKCSISNPMSIN